MVVTDAINHDQAKLVEAQSFDQNIGWIQIVKHYPLLVKILFQAFYLVNHPCVETPVILRKVIIQRF